MFIKKIVIIMCILFMIIVEITCAELIEHLTFNNETTGATPSGWDADEDITESPSATNKSIEQTGVSNTWDGYTNIPFLTTMNYTLVAILQSDADVKIGFSDGDMSNTQGIYIDAGAGGDIYCDGNFSDIKCSNCWSNSVYYNVTITMSSTLYFDMWVNGVQYCSHTHSRGTPSQFDKLHFTYQDAELNELWVFNDSESVEPPPPSAITSSKFTIGAGSKFIIGGDSKFII